MFEPRSPEEAEVYAVEELLAETQYCIQSVMGRKKVGRSELAKRLGCSPANVTQMLSEDSNLTLESIAKIFHALEDKVSVKSEYLKSRQARVSAEAFDVTWVRKPSYAKEALVSLMKQSIATAAVQSNTSLLQGSFLRTGQLDGKRGQEESLIDFDQAA